MLRKNVYLVCIKECITEAWQKQELEKPTKKKLENSVKII